MIRAEWVIYNLTLIGVKEIRGGSRNRSVAGRWTQEIATGVKTLTRGTTFDVTSDTLCLN
jgi:hypothetical protein